MYTKHTMFVALDNKITFRRGHTKKVSSLPVGTRKICHIIRDGSGKGREGESPLAVTHLTTDADLIANAGKA